jgi:hypothetical protein
LIAAFAASMLFRPIAMDRRASRYFENEKLFPDALDRSSDQPLPTISNCAHGLK